MVFLNEDCLQTERRWHDVCLERHSCHGVAPRLLRTRAEQRAGARSMASRGAADWQSMFVSLPREMNYELPRSSITGTLPADLQGCFTRNGPALFERGGNTRVHSVDGDGMIVRVVFKDGRLFFANRFVRTKGVRGCCSSHFSL